MVLTGSTAVAPPELPHDVIVEIAGHVATSSPRPLHDISSLRASCRTMRTACGDRAVGRRVALEREASKMRWADRERYRAVVEHLAGAGNPEACFLAGLTLVFADRRVPPGAQRLAVAAEAGHKAAAYVLGLLRYQDAVDGEGRDAAAGYIRQVEGEVDVDVDESNAEAACGSSYVAKKRMTNRECARCRAHAVEAVRDVTWNVPTRLLGSPAAPVTLLQAGHRCTAAGCGVPQGWSDCLAFCSEGCRIRHEYARFFSLVSLPVSVP